MELYPEVHVRGDAYMGGYTNGMTHVQTVTTRSLKEVSRGADFAEYEGLRGLRVKQTFCAHDGVTEVTTTAINQGTEPLTLDMLSSFAVKGLEADTLIRAASFWSAEGRLLTEKLVDLNMERSWASHGLRNIRYGSVGSMPVRQFFPFIALQDLKTGKCFGAQLYLPSSWQMEVFCFEDTYRVSGGLADRDFGAWSKTLQPGESFTSPKAVLAEADDLYTLCDLLVKAQHPDAAPTERDLPVMFNEYCTTWGNPTAENIKAIADRVNGLGFAYFVIDAGWYRNESPWDQSNGDWIPNKDMFPHGIEEVTKYLRDRGMIPGLWFELETCGPGAEAYTQYADRFLTRDGYPIMAGTKKFWDMEDPAVRAYLHERVTGLLKEKGFGYMKVDYNDTLGPGPDGGESFGETLRQKVLATVSFLDEVRAAIPGFVIENCASGGHRLEPSLMEHFSMASFSDAHECASIPVIAANLHRLIRPEQSQIWCVLRAEDTEERTVYSLVNTFLGRMCVSGDVHNLSDHQMDLLKEAIAFYHKAAPVIKDGKTVRIDCTASSYNKLTGIQVVERVLGEVKLTVAHRFGQSCEIAAPEGEVLARFGSLTGDFTAAAWLTRIPEENA